MSDIAETVAEVRDAVWCELLALYGEDEDTDWPYLTDLTDVIVGMIQKHGAQFDGRES